MSATATSAAAVPTSAAMSAAAADLGKLRHYQYERRTSGQLLQKRHRAWIPLPLICWWVLVIAYFSFGYYFYLQGKVINVFIATRSLFPCFVIGVCEFCCCSWRRFGMTSPLFIAHWFVASVPSSRVAKIVDLLLYTSNWHLKSGTTGTGSYRPFFFKG